MDEKNNNIPDAATFLKLSRGVLADVHQFTRYIRSNWPDIKTISQVKPEIVEAYLAELVRRGKNRAHIRRVCSSIRKLECACRHTGIFSADAPMVLPNNAENGLVGPTQNHSLWLLPLRSAIVSGAYDQLALPGTGIHEEYNRADITRQSYV